MSFTSSEALSAWVMNRLNERMRKNAEEMMLAGWSQDEVDQVLEIWKPYVERRHKEIMDWMERIRIELGNALPPQLPEHLSQD